jgi:integrase
MEAVPCDPNLMAQLQTWRHESPYSADTDWCFPSSRKKGTQPRVGNMICEDYLRPSAIAIDILSKDDKRRFGFHVFRHSLASYLVARGANPTVVHKLLRHSNVVTTLGLYSHAAGDDRLRVNPGGRFL